jgi:hypothetical protein
LTNVQFEYLDLTSLETSNKPTACKTDSQLIARITTIGRLRMATFVTEIIVSNLLAYNVTVVVQIDYGLMCRFTVTQSTSNVLYCNVLYI